MMKLPMPKLPELVEFIQARSLMTYEERMELSHPSIQDTKEAIKYWIQIYRQDNPLILFFGAIAVILLPFSIVFRLIKYVVAG